MGGWNTTITQKTVITPPVVRKTLLLIEQVIKDFNSFLSSQNISPVQLGEPTGSTSYYTIDPDDKIYGDIDIQVIVPNTDHLTHSRYSAYWSGLLEEFLKTNCPANVNAEESVSGHIIIDIGNEQYVQVDFMWHQQENSYWGQCRTKPQHGLKGLLTGNIYSTLGKMLNLSIQHAGVQYKLRDGKNVSFHTQKNIEVHTITTNPETFVLDIFHHFCNGTAVPLLNEYSGLNPKKVLISDLLNSIIGFALSLEKNQMFGKDRFRDYKSADDFLKEFIDSYIAKCQREIANTKRDKATTMEAIKRAINDRQTISDGLDAVKQSFSQLYRENMPQ